MALRIDMERALRRTDLAWRLGQISEGAAVQGIFFTNLDERARELGPAVQAAYRDYFKIYKFSAFRMYPCKDYLTRLVALADVGFDGDTYHGIRMIHQAAFPAWRRTLLGRSWFAIFGSDFRGVLKHMCSTLTSVANYCTAELVQADPLIVRFRNQYVYVEHAMVGSIEGVAKTCNANVRVEVQMSGPFTGNLVIQPLAAELPVAG